MVTMVAFLFSACGVKDTNTEAEETSASSAIAIVNGVEINRERFESILENEKMSREANGDNFETTEGQEQLQELRGFILTDLIRMELLQQFAKEKEIVVSDEEIDNYFEELYSFYGGEEVFKEQLTSTGYSEDEVRNFVVMDLMTGKIIEKEIPDVEITEEFTKEQYEIASTQIAEQQGEIPPYEEWKVQNQEQLIAQKKYEEFTALIDEFEQSSQIEKFD